MRFLISITLPAARRSAAVRQRLAVALRGIEATQLAPTLWLSRNEGADPRDAHTIADLLVNTVGPADEMQVIVAPMPYPGAGFGMPDDVARAIGAIWHRFVSARYVVSYA